MKATILDCGHVQLAGGGCATIGCKREQRAREQRRLPLPDEGKLVNWCERHESARGAYFVGRPGCDAGEYLGDIGECMMVPARIVHRE